MLGNREGERGESKVMKKSIWKDTAIHSALYFPKYTGEKTTDVVVIGAGITGLTTAMLLTEAGKKVIVLEASKIGDGTTGYSSCHLTTDIDAEYRNVYADFGEDIARLVAESRKAGIDFIENISLEKAIECDFKRVPGYLYAEIKENISDLNEELEYASKAGVDITTATNVPLPFKTEKALLFLNQAVFNSQKYLNSLARYSSDKGCEIFENSSVIHTEEKDDYFIVRTAEGLVKAKSIVFATHLPLFFNVLQTVAAPYISYMIGVRLKNDSYPEGLFWDMQEPYHYLRTYEDEKGKILLVGGEDHKTGHETNTSSRYDNLEKYVRERFEVEEVVYQWSSQYFEPADGLPYIGRSPFSKKAYVATGFSGDGLVYGTIAAMMISDMIKEKANKWLKAYDATRFTPAASAYDFIKENSDVAKHFITDRFKTEKAKEFDELKPGEGRLMNVNGEKLAVAKDKDNTIYALSPVCTHLKCFVLWNNSEKSWDCPCHGSRFNIKGEVITGPAVKALEQKQPTSKEGEKTKKG